MDICKNCKKEKLSCSTCKITMCKLEFFVHKNRSYEQRKESIESIIRPLKTTKNVYDELTELKEFIYE